MPYRFYLQTKDMIDAEAENIRAELEKVSGLPCPHISMRDVVIISGDPSTSSIEQCKQALCSEYCEILSEDEPEVLSGESCAITVLSRLGRTDPFADGIKAVLALHPYNGSINVRTGKQYVFSSPLNPEAYAVFSCALCDPMTQVIEGAEPEIHQEKQSQFKDNTVKGFTSATYMELRDFKEKLKLKLDLDDMMSIQNYFLSESREPTYTELSVIDRFFGEDFRHTTFETVIDRVKITPPQVLSAWESYLSKTKNKPTLSDIADVSKSHKIHDDILTIENKVRGIKITDDKGESYLLSFRSESRNRSVSAQPYDGAAICLSELEKNALCKLGYISDTYRVSGIPNTDEAFARAKLASNGFNAYSYATGAPCTRSTQLISSSYGEKQLEICSALSVSKLSSIEELYKKQAEPGDIIYLVGGRTGRDGAVCFEENGTLSGEFVPVANPGIINSINRLILRKETATLLHALLYVGSGGIICSIGRLSQGVIIHTEKIPAKTSDLTPEELILSESAERMIICVSQKDAKKFKDICHEESIQFAEIGEVTDSERIVVTSANDPREVSIKTSFLISGGTKKNRGASIDEQNELPHSGPFSVANAPIEKLKGLKKLFVNDNIANAESAFVDACRFIRFTTDTESSVNDESVGGAMLTKPFTSKIPDASVRYLTYKGKKIIRNAAPLCSIISFGTQPTLSRHDPYSGAYLSVVDATMKTVASGFGNTKLHLASEEYLPEFKDDSKQFGMALASLLGAFEAQKALGISSLGGRSSPGRVGSYKENNSGVAAFVVGVSEEKPVISRDFKNIGSKVVLYIPDNTSYSELPSKSQLRSVIKDFTHDAEAGKINAAVSLTARSVASGILEMCYTSGVGFKFDKSVDIETAFENFYGAIIAELKPGVDIPKKAYFIGNTFESYTVSWQKHTFDINSIFEKAAIKAYNYSAKDRSTIIQPSVATGDSYSSAPTHSYLWLGTPSDNYGTAETKSIKKIRAVIPVNNYYTVAVYDVRARLENSGIKTEVASYGELTPQHLVRAIERADILYIPDCMGNPYFSKAVFSMPEIRNALASFKDRGGLIYGEGNGLEVLLASGMLELDKTKIGICKNPSGSAVCSSGKVRLVSTLSPFMRKGNVGDIYDTVTSGRHLRLIGDPEYLKKLAFEGRIALQFLPEDNMLLSTEGICAVSSADGRVIGSVTLGLRLSDAPEFTPLPIIPSVVGYYKNAK